MTQSRSSGKADEPDRLVAEAIELRRAGQLQASAERFEQALRRAPAHPGALTSYAMLLLEAGEVGVALENAKRAVESDPERMSAHHALGRAQCVVGNLDAGIASLRRAVALRPDAFEAELDLGKALYDAVRLEEAEQHLDRARALAPLSAEVHGTLGNLYRRQHRDEEALAAYGKAIELKPGLAQAHNNRGILLAELGDGEGAAAALREALALAPDRPSTWSNLLLTMNWSDRLSPAQFAAEHRAFGDYFGARVRPLPPVPMRPLTGRRLKIGYVSSDFRAHAVAIFMLPLLERHDRQRFEIYALYNFTAEDEVTARIRPLVEHFVSIAGRSDAELGGWIRNEGIDILVDLNGHTSHNRLTLFLLKPAPIQVTWLGYLATTGLATIDYRLTDARADPVGMTEALHTETLWRLPDTLWCYAPHAGAPATGPLPMRANGYVTFASLNNPAKVSPMILGLWLRILDAMPDAHLILLQSALESRREQTAALFRARGIAPDRIELVSRQSTSGYLALHNRIDIALDTWPCAGGTTTCDALWMGVPVVTLAGERSFSRSGASILSTVGLSELVTEAPDQFVECAVRLAQDRPRLDALRAGLRERVRASPLADAGRFSAALEAAYVAMTQFRLDRASP